MALRGVKVAGIEATIRKKLKDPQSKADADRLAQGSMVRIGTHAANNAPVDTGLLQRTMTEGIERSKAKPLGAWDLIQKTDYTLVQEYVSYPNQAPENTGFIRNAVWTEAPHFKQAMEERFKKRKRG